MAKLSGDLLYDLNMVWDEDFGYKGSFAYSENRPDAPNPLLTITDIGPISLPLSEIDAKRIIAFATQFGPGTSTAIDKEVRDSWQIDPSLVGFQNPAWNSFLQSNTANICSGLGLPGGYDIQYKLHKLLLYETKSHFHRHQEYTDVMHEVKPITSGYRLVLSYNLMRCSPSGPEVMPTVDHTSELSRLHEILERWRTGAYKRLPKKRMAALVLGYQYSESDLDMGQAALKGQDVHKVNQIRLVAEMLGFELWLVKFKLYTMWYVREDSDGEEFWIPNRRIHWTCTLEYCTDLKGNRVHGEIDCFQGLIRGDSSSDNMGDPTNQEFERSPFPQDMPSAIRNYYRRTVLVIFNKEDMDRVMIIACGVKYGLGKLKTSLTQDNPTPDDRKIIDLLLQDFRMTPSDWKVLAQFPLRLHDLNLWNRIIERAVQRCYRCLITLEEEMFLAWDMFGFQQVQSSYDAISEREYNGDTIDFIHKVRTRAASLNGQDIVGAWCDKHIVVFVKGDNRAFNILDVTKTLISIRAATRAVYGSGRPMTAEGRFQQSSHPCHVMQACAA
ncbi:hypothetical protein M378DRAFT_18457 [Amanita muscaria Koide BX008]|uniref:Uncharacterized protein n=1 Tax=Amanita muscaria (strain Koide BX008) TaxID=946122 RepID=A0A0C2RX38_AMAMK|nr:hypothetical protein M378DRAFT_18457 [Amanita muscaria Koide BX008]